MLAGPATANSPNTAAAGKWDSQTDRRTPGASIPPGPPKTLEQVPLPSLLPPFLSPPLHSLLPPTPSPSPPLPSLPLEVGPLNAARGLGSAVSSPSRVWGGAPAEIEFGAF